MKYVVSGLVILNDQVLLVKNNHVDGPPNNFWSLPGGGVEEGESLVQALEREMFEETGFKSKIGKLLFINEYKLPDGSFAGPNFIFKIDNPEYFKDADFSIASHSFELAEIKFFNISEADNVKPPWLISKLSSLDTSGVEFISGS